MQAPLTVPEHGGLHIQVVLGPAGSGSRSVSIHSRPEGADEHAPWTLHAEGSVEPESGGRRSGLSAGELGRPGRRQTSRPSRRTTSTTARRARLQYGPVFQG